MTKPKPTTFGMTVDDYAKYRKIDSAAVQAALDAGQLTRAMDGTIDPQGPPIGLTQADYARHRDERGLRGGTRQMVSKAAREGWLTFFVDGTIDADASDVSWAQNATPRLDFNDPEPVEAPSSSPSPSPLPQPGKPQAAPAPVEFHHADLKEIKAEAELHKARKWKHEADVMEGRVIAKTKAKAAFDDIFRTVKQRVLAIPDRLSGDLAGLTDEQDVYRLLTKECQMALADSVERIKQKLDLQEPDNAC